MVTAVDLVPPADYPADPGPDYGRTPPQDIAAEQSVLGGCLLASSAIPDVLDLGLGGGDFYRPAHETIWDVVVDLYGRGEPVDAVTVSAELTRRGDLGQVGGPAYLHTLISSTPTAANAAYYGRIVRERSFLRRLVTAGIRITQLGYATDGGDVEAIRDAAQAEVFAATTDGADVTDLRPAGSLLEETIEAIQAAAERGSGLTGVPSGFMDLDKLTNGWQPGQFIIFGARPAVGKSCLAVDCARNAAIGRGLHVAFFSLEMSALELMQRILAAEARIPLHGIRKGDLTPEQWNRLANRQGRVEDAPLYIDDSPNITLAQIRAKTRRLRQRGELDLVVIDYLQLMTSGAKRPDSRQQEVSELSRSLKLLAKELGVPIIALSQLNRNSEQRHDKKPSMADLRESGSVEQDADIVLLIHREDMHEKESPRAGEADFLLVKHRNGPTDTITVAFQGHYSRFVDMAA